MASKIDLSVLFELIEVELGSALEGTKIPDFSLTLDHEC